MDDNTAGGLSAYVFVLIGMSFILYLFGYTNMYNVYTQTTSVNGTVITNPAIAMGLSIFQIMTSSFYGLLAIGTVTVGLIIIGIAEVFGAFKGATATILTYIIPIVLLLALNIFIFPIGSLGTDLAFADTPYNGAIITGGIFAIFNICYILAVIEFVRGGST